MNEIFNNHKIQRDQGYFRHSSPTASTVASESCPGTEFELVEKPLGDFLESIAAAGGVLFEADETAADGANPVDSPKVVLDRAKDDFAKGHLFMKLGEGLVLQKVQQWQQLMVDHGPIECQVINTIGSSICDMVATIGREKIAVAFGYNNWHNLGYLVVAMVWE